jgi:Cu-Zn family superoxide dismutase
VVGGPTRAVVTLLPTSGSNVTGFIEFMQNSWHIGVGYRGRVEGLAPNSKHALTIHQFGDISSSDGSALGLHFNPLRVSHACKDKKERHVGDLGNVQADESGVAAFVDQTEHISLKETEKNFIIGAGIAVHEKEDDCKTV